MTKAYDVTAHWKMLGDTKIEMNSKEIVKAEIAGVSLGVDDNLREVCQIPTLPQYILPLEHHNISTVDIMMYAQRDVPLSLHTCDKITNPRSPYTVFQNEAEYYFEFFNPYVIQDSLIIRMARNFSEVTLYVNKVRDQKETRNDLLTPFFVYKKLPSLLLMLFLSQRKGGLVHASAIDVDGQGYLFPGISGTGKSTLARQFIQTGAGRILNDDRVVVRKMDNQYHVFGTPWTGESGIAINANVPLEGIFFITHGAINQIKKISPQNALSRLVSTVLIPWYDSDIVAQMLEFFDDLITSIPMYELVCTPTPDVVDVIMDHVTKQEA